MKKNRKSFDSITVIGLISVYSCHLEFRNHKHTGRSFNGIIERERAVLMPMVVPVPVPVRVQKTPFFSLLIVYLHLLCFCCQLLIRVYKILSERTPLKRVQKGKTN